MTDLGDYRNFSVLTDVLLLADVFKNFRDVYLQHYGLDPVLNYSFPFPDVELDLLTDTDQHLSIEEGIKGGGAMISHRYAPANAPGMKNYDISKCNS